MLSQVPRSFTTHFQFVPTCEQTFWVYSQLDTNFVKVIYRKAVVPQSSCLSHSQLLPNLFTGTKNTKKSSCPSCSQLVPSSFITRSQMTKHTASELSLSPIEFTGSESSIEGFVKIARISTLTIPDRQKNCQNHIVKIPS